MSQRLLKYFFALLLICLLVWWVDFRSLWEALSQLTLFLAGYLLLISVLLIYVSALKWKLFVESYGKEASLGYLFHLYLVGYFVNLLVPSYIGGDVVRSWYIGKRIGQHEAAASTILERYTGLVAMIFLALVFLGVVSGVPVEVQIVTVLLAVGVVGLTVAALSPSVMGVVTRLPLIGTLEGHLKKIQEALILAKERRGLLIKTMLLSFLFHSVTVVNTFVAAYAVGWYDAPFWDLFVVLPLILLIGVIPLAPSGLGLQEGAFYFFLQLIGATPAQALGVGILLRAKSYVLALWGGAVWFFIRERKEPPAASVISLK